MASLREPYGFLDAALRYNRAREHLADINGILETFRAKPQEIGAKIELEKPDMFLELRDVPIPYDLPIRVGEMVYNLRATLDYLIFALAWHDTGVEPTGKWARALQFPVESDIKVFEGRRPRFLEGVSDPHIAMIREYQPAKGCAWTEVLVGISDADKHRHLSVFAGSYDHRTGEWVSVTTPIPEAVPDDSGLYDLGEMNMDTYATLDVAFVDGRLVTQTLEELQTQVRALLLRFAREFTLRPVP